MERAATCARAAIKGKDNQMKFEIIGGNKAFRTALKKKIAKELDPKGVLQKEKKGKAAK